MTYDLLSSLTQEELLFQPGEAIGPLWKQFRHLGRVQENYIEALETRKVTFTTKGSSYQGGPDPKALTNYLKQLDREMLHKLDNLEDHAAIDWFGEAVAVDEHLKRLDEHEILHHGQFIVYCKLLGKTFPESWAAWGL